MNIEKEETGEAPHFIQPLKPKIVEEDKTAVLECTVIGQPTPNIKWFKDNKELISSPTHKVEFNPETGNATLEILKPTPDDEKIYSVKADNKFGTAECRANIVLSKSVIVTQPVVMQAPKITQPVKAKIVKPDDEVVLEAEFEGTSPTVTWLRNGTEIKPSDEYNIETTDNKTILRVKKKVTKRRKGGKYEVRITNERGEASSSGSVTVSEEIPDAQPPRFIESIKPQRATVGEVVILEAVVEAVPQATFQWFHDTTPISSTPETRIITDDNKSTLLIKDIKPEDAGKITCRAENAVGSVTCAASLNVIEETEWDETRELEYPRFVRRTSPVRVMDGEKVEFSCVVTGKPIPKVEWFHNDVPVQEAKDVIISQTLDGVCKLAITEVFPENAGEYVCRAVNRVGEAICKTSLIVEAYEYIPDSELGHMTGSEEDLLADKVIKQSLEVVFLIQCYFYFQTISDTDFLSDSEVEMAPKIIKKLPQVLTTKDGDITR